MTCEEVAEFISEYLDRSLPLGQRLAFDLHLYLCADCRRYVDSFRKTRSLTRSLAQDQESVDLETVPESLVQAILSARSISHPSDENHS
jgi:predicted anti-sigma-YlaC factor YlaD